MFQDLKPVRWSVIVVYWIADAALVTLAVALFSAKTLRPIAAATNGLINETLIANLAIVLIEIVVVVLWLGKLKLADIGLIWSKLFQGLIFTFALWVLIAITESIISLQQIGTVRLFPNWNQAGPALIGAFLAQALGNALREEVGYRGFLLPQLHLKFSAHWPGQTRLCLLAALVISQSAFSLMHIPVRLSTAGQITVTELLRLFALGVVFAIIYLRTQNLFLAIGVHTLANAPTAVVVPRADMFVLLLIFTLVLVLVWPLLTRQRTRNIDSSSEISSA